MGKTLAEKIWSDHIVRHVEGEPDLLYIDLHLIHEVTSPQAFDGLRLANRKVRRPDLTLATEDHNVPTIDIDKPIADPVSKLQVDTLRKNCAEFGVRIPPHWFRDSAVTTMIHDSPQSAKITGLILGHTNPDVVQKHYNQAQMIYASRRHYQTIRALIAEPYDKEF